MESWLPRLLEAGARSCDPVGGVPTFLRQGGDEATDQGIEPSLLTPRRCPACLQGAGSGAPATKPTKEEFTNVMRRAVAAFWTKLNESAGMGECIEKLSLPFRHCVVRVLYEPARLGSTALPSLCSPIWSLDHHPPTVAEARECRPWVAWACRCTNAWLLIPAPGILKRFLSTPWGKSTVALRHDMLMTCVPAPRPAATQCLVPLFCTCSATALLLLR